MQGMAGSISAVRPEDFGGLDDDIRARMFEAADRGETFALATIVSANGGLRPVGSQMVITRDAAWGYLSGGCIEADIALHGREVIDDGAPRTLVYGAGSPFIDIRLPCGGSITIALERVEANDPAVHRLRDATAVREPAMWLSDGFNRKCVGSRDAHQPSHAFIRRRYDPAQRLVVIGSNPFALAIAALGTTLTWNTRLLSPFAPAGTLPFGVQCDRRALPAALADLQLDPWTAVAVATHDLDHDHTALVATLPSAAGYVGVLGSRRKLAARQSALRAAGVDDGSLDRLRAPIGLPIEASAPLEIALAVVAEIVALRHKTSADTDDLTRERYVLA